MTVDQIWFGTCCWRPLCPYGHSGRGRAARWAALWSLLAEQEAQFVDVPVPQIQEQILEFAEISPQRRIPECIVEHTRDVPVPQIREQFVEVVRNIPQERISERIAELTVDVPTPQILEEIVEAISAPHERVQQRTVEQINDAMKKEEMAWRRADRARKRMCQQYYSSRSSRSAFQ